MAKCKHSLEEENCFICQNPDKFVKNVSLKELIDLSHYDEDWTEEEFEKLYEIFKNIQNIHSKLFRVKVKETANRLGRSNMAIIYQHRHMFINLEWNHSHNLYKVMERVIK
jgi:hypothetical protein